MGDSAHTGSFITRRNVLIGGVLAAASGVAYARQPQIYAKRIEEETFKDWVPTEVDGWRIASESGVVLPPPDSLSDRLYDNLATGVYTKRGETPVMMLLAYNNSQDGVLQVHRPEVCYPVGGFALSPTMEVPLHAGGRTIPSNFFTAKSQDRTEQVAYFTRLGSAFPRSWFEQRMAVIEANLQGKIPDGMLMRVSVLSNDRDAAFEKLERFAASFIEASPAPLRQRLIG